MKVVQQYPDGMFCWIDLATTDIEAARAFYSGLFGWEGDIELIGDHYAYTNFNIGGYNVAGGGQMEPDTINAGLPPSWSSYVKHHDIAAVAGRVEEAGGSVLVPPMEIPGQGHMAVFMDPTGATFGAWQPGNHIGAQLVNQPNTLVWNELQTNDVERARAFYRQVFGWSDHTYEGSDYTVWQDNNGRAHCGTMEIGGDWDGAAPNWLVYFLVDDVDGTVARAAELGGHAVHGPSDSEGFGRLAVLADPQGATFAVIKFNGTADEPPGY